MHSFISFSGNGGAKFSEKKSTAILPVELAAILPTDGKATRRPEALE
jgi:hypothetical protein